MLNITKIKQVLANQPKYRLTQASQAVFSDLVDDWQEVGTLPLTLRQKLNESCPLAIEAEMQSGVKQKVVKALINLDDRASVETVLMRHGGGRNTVCVSSQVGCPLACVFCATGQGGFVRNLTSDEIVSQIIFFARKIKPERITNVVFMGMGEPLLNWEEVKKAVLMINNDLGISARQISISTAGILAGIDDLAEWPLQVNLAISLHAANDRLRSRLMPINKQVSIRALLKAVDNYIEKTNRQVMFEYLLIKGVNDSSQDAENLAKLMQKKLYMVNLLAYNATGSFEASEQVVVKTFKDILETARVRVTVRRSFGSDINAACGQLSQSKSCKSKD